MFISVFLHGNTHTHKRLITVSYHINDSACLCHLAHEAFSMYDRRSISNRNSYIHKLTINW